MHAAESSLCRYDWAIRLDCGLHKGFLCLAVLRKLFELLLDVLSCCAHQLLPYSLTVRELHFECLQDGPALVLDLLGSCFTDQLRPPSLTPADVASYLEQSGGQTSSSDGNTDLNAQADGDPGETGACYEMTY